MSLETIRTDIVTAVEAAKAGFNLGYTLVVEYENRIVVDTKTQTNPFLTVETIILDGSQLEIANAPHHRLLGQIHIAAAVPDGSGASQANRLLDWFIPKLHGKTFNTVRTKLAVPSKPIPHLGWQYYGVAIPFWSDQPS
jgi:hypothetical protein